MEIETALILTILFFVAAVLYSSVGHAGASGYLAAMTLLGVSPLIMRPTALLLNLLVAGIGSYSFLKRGFFSWRLFWPFAIASVPCAYLGGSMTLPTDVYKQVLGLVLLFSSARLMLPSKNDQRATKQPPSITLAIVLGVMLGFLAGLTGVGGGIFLSPLLLLTRWSEVRQTAGISVVFILVNSLSGLAGYWSQGISTPPYFPFWLMAAGVGGWIGSTMGSGRLKPEMLRKILGVVLMVAGAKLLFR